MPLNFMTLRNFKMHMQYQAKNEGFNLGHVVSKMVLTKLHMPSGFQNVKRSSLGDEAPRCPETVGQDISIFRLRSPDQTSARREPTSLRSVSCSLAHRCAYASPRACCTASGSAVCCAVDTRAVCAAHLEAIPIAAILQRLAHRLSA